MTAPVLLALLLLAPAGAKNVSILSIRHYSSAESTIVTIEVSGVGKTKLQNLDQPSRVVLDLPDTKIQLPGHGTRVIAVDDGLVRQIRVAQNTPKSARVVLDLARDANATMTLLKRPLRVNLEVRLKTGSAPPAAPAPDQPRIESPATEKRPVGGEAPALTGKSGSDSTRTPGRQPAQHTPPPAATSPVNEPAAAAETNAAKAEDNARALAAARNSTGGRTLTRVLGLKLARVVIDAGHGGKDEGSPGPTGLLEKNLVLDVALRLGDLIEQRLGAKVVYTRSTDVFIPLEERTAIANRASADLFISIHANSSPIKNISGAETYFLSARTSADSADVAARENSVNGRSIYELEDLLKKIALNEKVTESKELAAKLQPELYTVWNRMSGTTRNRGVKKAPFVVLIGAHMPSVLIEIGFISNLHDEALLKKPDQRQRVAEALYRGVDAYASTLSRVERTAQKQLARE